MIFAFYLLQRYAPFLYHKIEGVIDTLLNNVNEYTETNGSLHYQSGIIYFEEKLVSMFY